MGVRTALLERRPSPDLHPRAHYINNRTMEIFRHISGLESSLRAACPPLSHWRRFLYTTGAVQGSILADVDHFPKKEHPGDDAVSPTHVAHVPQPRVVEMLGERVARHTGWGEGRPVEWRRGVEVSGTGWGGGCLRQGFWTFDLLTLGHPGLA